jgi:hypothetical protein
MTDGFDLTKVGEVITTADELLQVGIDDADQTIVVRCFPEPEEVNDDSKFPPPRWVVNLGAYDALILGQILLQAADSQPSVTFSHVRVNSPGRPALSIRLLMTR